MKTRYSLSRFLSKAIYVGLIFSLSCTEKVDPLSIPDQTDLSISGSAVVSVNEAKAYFETALINIENSKNNNSLKKKKKPVQVPIWSLATNNYKNDGYNMLSIPLIQDEHELGIYGNRKLLVYKNKKDNNKLTFAIIEAFADSTYLKLNGFQFDSRNFSGTLLFHDLEKGYESGFIMKNGKQIGVVKDLKEFDDHGVLQTVTPSVNRSSNREADCVITVYEKCYGTKYQDSNGQWIYSLSECFADRTERSPGCEESYWPIWLNYVDFSNNGQPQSEFISKVGYLGNKLTVSFFSRPCLHEIINKIINSANPLSRLGSILQASGLSYDFYKFVSDLTSPQTNYTIYITESSSLSGVNAVTTTQPGRVTISLSSQYMSNATDLAVARTVTHELIHAYLEVGQSNPQSFGPAFQAVNNYLNTHVGFSGNDEHHNLMANEYRTTISTMLNNYVAVTGITIPPSMGSIQDYNDKMAWGGLQFSARYLNLSPAEKNAIVDVLTKEQIRAPDSSSKKGC